MFSCGLLTQEVCLHPLLACWLDNVSLSSALRGLAPSQTVHLASYVLKWLRVLDSKPPWRSNNEVPCVVLYPCEYGTLA